MFAIRFCAFCVFFQRAFLTGKVGNLYLNQITVNKQTVNKGEKIFYSKLDLHLSDLDFNDFTLYFSFFGLYDSLQP